jgi:hypothetical protein
MHLHGAHFAMAMRAPESRGQGNVNDSRGGRESLTHINSPEKPCP